MARFRACIVDDERPARKRLAELLARAPDVELAGEFESGADARHALRRLKPDLLFVDVRMPEVDGFGVVDALPREEPPVTIFVTAYDEHAVRAFEAAATDYILKPFSDERFETALARALERLRSRRSAELGGRILELVDLGVDPKGAGSNSAGGAHARRIVVKSASRTAFVDTEEIVWIEAQGVYVNLHTASGEHLLRESLSSLERRLDPRRFARIHRSAVVALGQVRELRFEPSGAAKAVLRDGSSLRVSRRHRPELENRLLER